MHMIWQGGTSRGGVAQWLFFAAVVAVIGLVALVLAAFGLVVGAVLVGIFSVVMALISRRRHGGASVYAVPIDSDGREPEGDCVELSKDAYTVRIVDEKKPLAGDTTADGS